MTTRWGLDLDMSAVRLMRREGEDWVENAVEKIDSPDIEERLETLIAPVDGGGPVMLFLPRDQILYTTVELDARQDPRTQIERAMDGRTPYSLDELSLDWETDGENTVRVAAIARDTLDEAAAFAEVRNLGVSGYSTLFSGEDFPRLPRFDGPDLVDAPEAPKEPVAFATARVPSRPPEASLAAASAAATAKARFTPQPPPEAGPKKEVSKPVIEVEDAVPVVQVKAPKVPLDPGLPIAAPNAPPRIRTDIAAASVSGHAASLTPPGGSVRMRRNRAPISTLAVFAIAFMLTVGIAVFVWNVLPMRPASRVEAPVDIGALPRAVVEEAGPATHGGDTRGKDTAGLAPEADTPLPDTAAVTEAPEEALASLDAAHAAPNAEAGIAAPDAPKPDAAPQLAAVAPGPQPAGNAVPPLDGAKAGSLPQVDPDTPAPPLPRMTATIGTAPPFLGPEPDIEANSEGIYVSAFELPDPATNAIALPDARGLNADALPEVSGAEVAALDPAPGGDPVSSAVEQALADALAGPGGLIPTDLARALPETPPRARPDRFTEDIERLRFGGRTLTELSELRPPARPASAQSLASHAAAQPSELAVAASRTPRARPVGFDGLVADARTQAEAVRVTATAALAPPDTSRAIEAALAEDEEPANRAVRPRSLGIPTSASVARQATIENAIRLNRINLVGVYGAPSDRRALVRLASGRYVKVKVGDRVDGGTVAQITDSQLYYRKGNRTLSLSVPQG